MTVRGSHTMTRSRRVVPVRSTLYQSQWGLLYLIRKLYKKFWLLPSASLWESGGRREAAAFPYGDSACKRSQQSIECTIHVFYVTCVSCGKQSEFFALLLRSAGEGEKLYQKVPQIFLAVPGPLCNAETVIMQVICIYRMIQRNLWWFFLDESNTWPLDPNIGWKLAAEPLWNPTALAAEPQEMIRETQGLPWAR